ncbi:hypothetical protein SAMN05216404_11672 [Nitrosospira multiformis]|uniref:Uncharacterized protein n=1 Tax=Nitrosospira multiformis TaxID=1231 RepID=A0A1H8NJV4_9PROT|nr:hypothetical protein SAMN05216404_11672 [Nitrosospira multiformis]
MLQKDDLLIVYIAYQQTYPQQLWTIEKAVITSRFFPESSCKGVGDTLTVVIRSKRQHKIPLPGVDASQNNNHLESAPGNPFPIIQCRFQGLQFLPVTFYR